MILNPLVTGGNTDATFCLSLRMLNALPPFLPPFTSASHSLITNDGTFSSATWSPTGSLSIEALLGYHASSKNPNHDVMRGIPSSWTIIISFHFYLPVSELQPASLANVSKRHPSSRYRSPGE